MLWGHIWTPPWAQGKFLLYPRHRKFFLPIESTTQKLPFLKKKPCGNESPHGFFYAEEFDIMQQCLIFHNPESGQS